MGWRWRGYAADSFILTTQSRAGILIAICSRPCWWTYRSPAPLAQSGGRDGRSIPVGCSV
jgi:hypothetical protein